MSLADIVRALGGDLYGPRGAMIPAPKHSKRDRSVSLLVDPDNRLIVSTFGGTPWWEVLDDLRSRGFIDDKNRLRGSGRAEAYHDERQFMPDAARVTAARGIFDAGRPVAGTLSEAYIASRGVVRPLPGDDVVRHCSATPLRAYEPDKGGVVPAMLLAIRDLAGDLFAVEITYLDQTGRRHPRMKLSRKTVGVVPPGAAVQIDGPAPEMLVGEGFITTMRASERFSLPAWALLTTGRMRAFKPPEGVRRVLVAGDNGEDGRRSARILANRLRAEGLVARTAFPPPQYGDFDDWAEGRVTRGSERKS